MLCLMWSVDPFVWINYGGLESVVYITCVTRSAGTCTIVCAIEWIALKVSAKLFDE